MNYIRASMFEQFSAYLSKPAIENRLSDVSLSLKALILLRVIISPEMNLLPSLSSNVSTFGNKISKKK